MIVILFLYFLPTSVSAKHPRTNKIAFLAIYDLHGGDTVSLKKTMMMLQTRPCLRLLTIRYDPLDIYPYLFSTAIKLYTHHRSRTLYVRRIPEESRSILLVRLLNPPRSGVSQH